MTKKTWSVLGGIALLLVLAWLCMPRKKPSRNQEFADATFTRPSALSESAKEFTVKIEGVDGLHGVPTVACNTTTLIEITFPQPLTRDIHSILIVPRLPSQGEEGFLWEDVHCDLRFALDSNSLISRNSLTYRVEQNIRWNPGEYVVRYYRQIIRFDAEQGPPLTEYLGEGHIRVETLSPGDAVTGVTPLAEKKYLIPLIPAKTTTGKWQ